MKPEITKKTSTPSQPYDPDCFSQPAGRKFGLPFVKWYQHTASAAMPRSESTAANRGVAPITVSEMVLIVATRRQIQIHLAPNHGQTRGGETALVSRSRTSELHPLSSLRQGRC